MKKGKRKMSLRKFRIITIPIIAVLTAFIIALTVITNYFTASLDTFLGKGSRAATTPAGTSSWDTEYYDFASASQEDAALKSSLVAEKIAEEGEVLLKNDGLLPLSRKTKITPFGYDYINPRMSGSGSGSGNTDADYAYNAERSLHEAFDNVNTTVEEAMKKAEPHATNPKGAGGEGGATAFLGAASTLNEYPVNVYDGLEDSCKESVGIVFIGRAGGEGGDVYTKEYEDGTPHMLALTQDEKDTINYAKKNCAGVVVVINACNAMELAELEDDQDVNAVITICTPGAMGFKALGLILNGSVNPSGRVVDTYLSDNKTAPTFVNFDDGTGMSNYTNAQYTRSIWLSKFKGGPDFKAPFREYEEGVYLGYRYYETAADLGYFKSDNLPAHEQDPYYNRTNGVVYPFGYGLSYTEFSQEFASFTEDADTIRMEIRVENTGSAAGKDVVQLYYSAPYTDFDIENSIEKPSVELLDFGKTEELQPGEAQTLTFDIPKEDLASYCYTHDNGDGTKGCYVLEEGDYAISIRSDSHSIIDQQNATVDATLWYDGSDAEHIRTSEIEAQSELDDQGEPVISETVAYKAAVNHFENANTYMTDPSVGNNVSVLTRNDWENTQPTAPDDTTRTATDTVKKWLDYNYATTDLGHGTWDSVNDPVLGSNENSKVYVPEDKMPKSRQKNGVTLSEMRGLSYDDPKWDALLDQIDYSSNEITGALFANGYASKELTAVGKMPTSEHDGPQGITLNDNDGKSWVSCCTYPAETVLAQTWNIDLAEAMGEAVGEENYWINGGGWYAPAVNLHWSAFSGRNYEYFSEDPIISGKMAAQIISGAGQKGTYCALKHFAMVDQEEERWWIPSVWATEQTIREIYLKPFEMAVKEARKTIRYISDDQGTVSEKTMRAADCMMTSGWSGIGGLWSAYDYNLITSVLRQEWGFRGFVITDYDQGNCENDDIAVNRMVRAGVDQHMIDMTLMPGSYTSLDTATGVYALRNAIKNTLFTMANSAQVNGAAPGAKIYYRMSPWRVGVIAADVLIGAIVVMLILANVARTKAEGKESK